ncbi:putative endo-polygalacturonase [Helianthus annuus]|nr:putative endo-polygalacturonase [Helianthus annuus]
MSNHGDSWLLFSMVSGLTVSGNGQIDGQGPIWWENACIGTPSPALQFKRCIGLRLSGLTHVNSPRVHITITTCNNVIVSNLHIIAPETSPNTDGIDISGSINVNIRDSIIATDVVENVDVHNCTMIKTLTGVRIKTYQGGTGYANKISFTGIKFDATSAVNLSDITYRGISGTSNTDNVINLSCSKTVACTNIVVDSVHIKSAIPGRKVYGSCINACGRATHVQPYLDCLKPSTDLCNGPLS